MFLPQCQRPSFTSIQNNRQNYSSIYLGCRNRLWYSLKKCDGSRQTNNDDVIGRMRFACRITKATRTHSEYVIILLLHSNGGYAKAPQCYVISTLSFFSGLLVGHTEFDVNKLDSASVSEACTEVCRSNWGKDVYWKFAALLIFLILLNIWVLIPVAVLSVCFNYINREIPRVKFSC